MASKHRPDPISALLDSHQDHMISLITQRRCQGWENRAQACPSLQLTHLSPSHSPRLRSVCLGRLVCTCILACWRLAVWTCCLFNSPQTSEVNQRHAIIPTPVVPGLCSWWLWANSFFVCVPLKWRGTGPPPCNRSECYMDGASRACGTLVYRSWEEA